jgi:transcription elongation factor Elf1
VCLPPVLFNLATTNTAPDLSAPVDVYAEWVDACDSVAKENTEESRAWQQSSRGGAVRGSMTAQHDPEDYADEEDHDGGYEGEGIVGDDEEY